MLLTTLLSHTPVGGVLAAADVTVSVTVPSGSQTHPATGVDVTALTWLGLALIAAACMLALGARLVGGRSL